MNKKIMLFATIAAVFLTACSNKKNVSMGELEIAVPDETPNTDIQYESFSDGTHTITEPETVTYTDNYAIDYETLIDINAYTTPYETTVENIPTEICTTEQSTTAILQSSSTSESTTIKLTEPYTEKYYEESTVMPIDDCTSYANGHIKSTIQCGNKQLIIDADVIGGVNNSINTYSFEAVKLSEEEVHEFISELFGEEASDSFKYDANRLRYYGVVDGMSAEVDVRYGVFVYKCFYQADKKYSYLGKHTDNLAPGCDLTAGQCKTIADKYFAKNKMNKYIYAKCEIGDQGQDPMSHEYTQKGYYSYIYNQYVDDLPVFERLGHYAFWDVRLVDEHVESLGFNPRKYICTGTYECMDAVEAVNYLRRNSDWLSQANLKDIYKIMLVYADGNREQEGNPTIKDHTLEPYWVFLNNDRYAHKFAVNAITGAVVDFMTDEVL